MVCNDRAMGDTTPVMRTLFVVACVLAAHAPVASAQVRSGRAGRSEVELRAVGEVQGGITGQFNHTYDWGWGASVLGGAGIQVTRWFRVLGVFEAMNTNRDVRASAGLHSSVALLPCVEPSLLLELTRNNAILIGGRVCAYFERWRFELFFPSVNGAVAGWVAGYAAGGFVGFRSRIEEGVAVVWRADVVGFEPDVFGPWDEEAVLRRRYGALLTSSVGIELD